MNKSHLKNSQGELFCYSKCFVKMTQLLSYIRRERPNGIESFSYSYNDDPGQNETEITRDDYKAVRGIKEFLLRLENVEFSDTEVNNLRVDVRKILQIILESPVTKLFHVHGKFNGSDVKGTALFKSKCTRSTRQNSLRIEKKLEFKLKGYTSFVGQFSFKKIVVNSKECWEADGVTASNYILNKKKYQLIHSLPEDACVGGSGEYMEIEDSSDKAKLSWRLENKFGRIHLVFIDEASKLQRNLSYSLSDFYELDLDGNFYHYQTRMEFSNGDALLLNRDGI